MITYQGGSEGGTKKRKPAPRTQTFIGPRAPNHIGADMNKRLRKPSSQYANVGMDTNERLYRQRQQAERDRLNKLYGERLNAQYKAWFTQWRDKQNAVWAGRLYGQLNQFQSYVPPEETQAQPMYGGGSYADYGGYGGGGGGSTYQAPPPEWYLQSVVWKI